jgi:hypothetical protein
MKGELKLREKVILPYVEQMPDQPKESPLDWGFIATRFHDHVLNPENKIKFEDEKGKIKFGAFYEDGGHELITYGGIVLGKILCNEDVTELLPSLEDYYSETFGIFLNHPDNKLEEYWYLMYVNCLAAEIIRKRLIDNAAFSSKLERSLDSLVEIAHQVNYDFNDQGYDFAGKKPFTNEEFYRQPDTIGAYAYLMLLGYETFENESYLDESVEALTVYESFDTNPWYEIPSGAMACLAGAKLNSMGYSFDLNKILNFALDAKEGCLHVGTWGEKEVNGLMLGWHGYSREDAEKTAYSLETFLLLPFILPVVRYDVRFAKWIGKYALNMSANSKLFFPDYMPQEAQSRPELSADIPYETLHQNKEGHSPYAFGDFHSHKSVYGGALTLWLDSIVQKTEDDFILQLNVTKTNFLTSETSPTYLYYNPYSENRTITLNAGEESVDIYDLESKGFVRRNSRMKVELSIPGKSTRVVSIVMQKR